MQLYFKPPPLRWAGCSGRSLLLRVEAAAELIDFSFVVVALLLAKLKLANLNLQYTV